MTDNTLKYLLLASSVVVGLAGCGRETTPTDVKFAGVGLDPQEIGPSPTMYGGVFEYDFVDFAGAGLPLGLMGLIAYDEVGPGYSLMKPPYAMVTGLGFIMDSDLPETDTLFGSFGAPSGVEGTCYTNYEPTAYLNNTTDAGTYLKYASTDEDDYFEFEVGRRPLHWPSNNQEALFTYYLDLDAWQSQPLYNAAPLDDGTFDQASLNVLKPANWVHGKEVEISFPGGMPPEEAPIGSIPMPLAAGGGNTKMTLPNHPEGVMLSWTGPRYDRWGQIVADGPNNTCFQYLQHEDDPSVPEDCLTLAEPPFDPTLTFDDMLVETEQMAQMYTGPWETEGGVTLRWIPPDTDVGDVVTVSVRFLGPVDTDDKYKNVALIQEEEGLYREALACEEEGEDFEWQVDPALLQEDGRFVTSLQGEPTHNLAEVTCTVPDTGEFTITEEMLANALDYALRHETGGAIFYMTRTSQADIDTPPVRDKYGQKREISAIKAVSSSVVLGRFWWND